jgi:glucose/arabinose dehydrogenase
LQYLQPQRDERDGEMMPRTWVWLGLMVSAANVFAASQSLPLDKIKLPPGFTIEVVARVDNAREMALGDDGTLFVGSMSAGKIYAVTLPANAPAHVTTIASGLTLPLGVAFRSGSLYASSVNRILRFDNIEQHLSNPLPPVVVSDKFPSDTHHGGKFIAFGPDGKLYVPVGAPCNICEPDPARYANIMRMNADGSALEVYARGIRDSVGFDWDPRTKELWFTDNGRDSLGDDVPGDELNHASRAGLDFGYPYCHAGDVRDPEYGQRHECKEFVAPAQVLGAHVAALGMRFYTGSAFPAAYRNQVFIAEHGSWNRSSKVGYRITLVRVENGKATGYEPFATGWLQGESPWGRPADVMVMPDGSLMVADDYAGAIYRIRYRGQ